MEHAYPITSAACDMVIGGHRVGEAIVSNSAVGHVGGCSRPSGRKMRSLWQQWVGLLVLVETTYDCNPMGRGGQVITVEHNSGH